LIDFTGALYVCFSLLNWTSKRNPGCLELVKCRL